MKQVYCPNCGTYLSSVDYIVDLQRGVVCCECNSVIFPVDEKNQPKLKKTETTKPVSSYPSSVSYSSFGSGVHQPM